MVCGGIGYMWLGRLKEKAPAGEFNDASTHAARPARESHYDLKLGMPEVQTRTEEPSQERRSEPDRKGNAQNTSNTDISSEEALPTDCPAAAESLDIASKLAKLGDFEGVCEIADIVLESDDATEQQKIQARTLKRQCSPR